MFSCIFSDQMITFSETVPIEVYPYGKNSMFDFKRFKLDVDIATCKNYTMFF